MRLRLPCGVGALALVVALPPAAARADDAPPTEVVVTGARGVGPDAPNTHVSVTAEQLAATTNLLTPEDAVRYLPSLFVRQRHPGDTQSPLATRTSGVGASARSLIYVDGVLLSALIGNNNTSASPKWALVNPDAIDRVDVLYGPFAAAYPGNSIGAVVSFTTRMPKALEADVEVQGAAAGFDQYRDQDTVGTGRFAGSVGDRLGPFAFRLSYNHLETDAQPLTYATTPVASTATGGAPVTGAVLGASRTGVAQYVLGATAIEHQSQDNLSGRFTYDLTPAITAAYTVGLFRNLDDATDDSYLRDATGAPVYAGKVSIAGRGYTLANALFSGGVYHEEEDQLAQGLSLASHTGGAFDFDLTGSRFDYLKSRQRIPSGALPAAYGGGPGSTTSLDGTGWWTLDASGTWRPPGFYGTHVVSFGAHGDAFHLNTPKYALADWIDGPAGATQTFSRGRTATQALWVQDAWRPAAAVLATVGGRWEHWNAYDGLNFSASPALDRVQPALSDWRFSPKGVLAVTPAAGWTLKGSIAKAYRFPTVSELYQQVTSGPILAVPNPNLRPEDDLSAELSLEHTWRGGDARVSLFGERIRDALISQTGVIPGAPAPATFVQNVDHVRTRGVEAVASQDDVLVHGLSLTGSINYVDGRTVSDRALPAADGKRIPQLPPLRATAVATWTATSRLTATVAARYSDRSFGAIDNSDTYADTYQGFGAYFVVDAHLRYRFTPHLTGELGVDNLLNRAYFEFHPFPQRTVVADLAYAY